VKRQEIEILQLDQEALKQQVNDIIKNKRLAWLIVEKWLNLNNKVLQDSEQAEKEFQEALNEANMIKRINRELGVL